MEQIQETKHSKEHSIDGERCLTCSRLKGFDGEGKFVGGYWFCCWNCIQKAKEREIITEEEISGGHY